ncbi:hypothetical protein Trihar35433_2243 [Trichoderma harzianum]|nr:hypothetical protein Trihar35433_2243 [Trichoderma harzianum]
MESLADTGLATMKRFKLLQEVELKSVEDQPHESPKQLILAQFDRFELWAVNLGVFVMGHGSLDYRIRDSESMKEAILQMMKNLNRSLDEALAYLHGDIEQEDEDEDTDSCSEMESDMDLLLDSIKDPIDRLYKMAVWIRNPATRITSTKARNLQQVDEETNVDLFKSFENFDYDHVSSLFLEYEKNKALQEDPIAKPHDAVGDDEALVEDRLQDKNEKVRAPLTVTTATQLRLSHEIGKELEKENVMTLAVSEYAPSAWNPSKDIVSFPSPPKASPADEFFECPYCYTICPASILSEKAWRSFNEDPDVKSNAAGRDEEGNTANHAIMDKIRALSRDVAMLHSPMYMKPNGTEKNDEYFLEMMAQSRSQLSRYGEVIRAWTPDDTVNNLLFEFGEACIGAGLINEAIKTLEHLELFQSGQPEHDEPVLLRTKQQLALAYQVKEALKEVGELSRNDPNLYDKPINTKVLHIFARTEAGKRHAETIWGPSIWGIRRSQNELEHGDDTDSFSSRSFDGGPPSISFTEREEFPPLTQNEDVRQGAVPTPAQRQAQHQAQHQAQGPQQTHDNATLRGQLYSHARSVYNRLMTEAAYQFSGSENIPQDTVDKIIQQSYMQAQQSVRVLVQQKAWQQQYIISKERKYNTPHAGQDLETPEDIPGFDNRRFIELMEQLFEETDVDENHILSEDNYVYRRNHAHRHLDASAGREVVYCHSCAGEWYRDELRLLCPRCGSDITEIVIPDNDPQSFSDDDDSEAESPPLRHRFPPRDKNNNHDSDQTKLKLKNILEDRNDHLQRDVIGNSRSESTGAEGELKSDLSDEEVQDQIPNGEEFQHQQPQDNPYMIRDDFGNRDGGSDVQEGVDHADHSGQDSSQADHDRRVQFPFERFDERYYETLRPVQPDDQQTNDADFNATTTATASEIILPLRDSSSPTDGKPHPSARGKKSFLSLRQKAAAHATHRLSSVDIIAEQEKAGIPYLWKKEDNEIRGGGHDIEGEIVILREMFKVLVEESQAEFEQAAEGTELKLEAQTLARTLAQQTTLHMLDVQELKIQYFEATNILEREKGSAFVDKIRSYDFGGMRDMIKEIQKKREAEEARRAEAARERNEKQAESEKRLLLKIEEANKELIEHEERKERHKQALEAINAKRGLKDSSAAPPELEARDASTEVLATETSKSELNAYEEEISAEDEKIRDAIEKLIALQQELRRVQAEKEVQVPSGSESQKAQSRRSETTWQCVGSA